MPEECKGPDCQVHIWFALPHDPASKSKGIPFALGDLDQPDGNYDTWRDGQQVLRYRYIPKAEMGSWTAAAGHRRALSHFATCPNAKDFRRKPG